MGRGRKVFLKPAEFVDELRMVKESDEKMNSAHHIDVQRLKTYQRQRPKEKE